MMTTSERLHRLRTTGFHKLREGRIHVRCYSCGRKQSNTARMEWDPPGAFLCENECERCGAESGSKDPEFFYYDASGNELPDHEEDRRDDA